MGCLIIKSLCPELVGRQRVKYHAVLLSAFLCYSANELLIQINEL